MSEPEPVGRTTEPGSPPKLLITLELESDTPRMRYDARSSEDELRLRQWLRRSAVVGRLGQVVGAALDELDQIDRRRAA